MFKRILGVLAAVLIIAMPLSAGAVVDERAVERLVNISVTLDGATPTSGEYSVIVTEKTIDDESYEPTGKIEHIELNAGNGYAHKFNIDVSKVFYRYEFQLEGTVEGVLNDTRIFSVEIGQDILQCVDSFDEDNPQIFDISDQSVTFNAVFSNKTAPKLTEVKVKAVSDKKISKVYDGNVDAVVTADCFQIEGITDGADVKLEFASAKFNDPNVKKAKEVVVSGFKLSGRDASSYKVVTEEVKFQGEITERQITVSAINTVMTIGEIEPKLNFSVVGELVGDDKLVGNLARTSGNEVGTYVITIGTLALSANSDNYSIIFNEGIFTISSYSKNSLTDSESKISVDGFFDKSASFTVTPISATDSNYKMLFENAAWGKVVSAYNLSLDGFDGEVTIVFPIPAEYKGKDIAIYQMMSNGAVTCLKTVATDTVSLSTLECTQFMLVAEKGATDDSENKEKRSTVATIFLVLLIVLGVLVGLVLIIVALFFGMVFFNKTEELKAIIRGIKKMFRK